ncbi:hypothetical protein BDP27DRAFT_1426242 [Rhodocollybia butyracea]|uniref:Uncharacterized protein n=1 Tax=Rhodocollybia butyracea TaxID=206335 RepID=A0A9P5PLA2_9AGAR|nr:hypothetical protein BDP27DRAFT_1426242 [Rhodocollybia butyracea]
MPRHRDSLCTTAAEEHLVTSSLRSMPKNQAGSESILRNSASALAVLGPSSLESEGFAGDVSSPIRDPMELEMTLSVRHAVADGQNSDLYESIPSISQFEFTRTQESLLNSQNWTSHPDAERQDRCDHKTAAAAMATAITVTTPSDAAMSPSSDTLNSPSPPATQSQPGSIDDTDMKDLDIVWYQERVAELETENVQLEAQLASYRARESLWNRLAVTMAEHASDVGDTLNEAVMWGVDQIKMPPPPARFAEPDAFGFQKNVE